MALDLLDEPGRDLLNDAALCELCRSNRPVSYGQSETCEEVR